MFVGLVCGLGHFLVADVLAVAVAVGAAVDVNNVGVVECVVVGDGVAVV